MYVTGLLEKESKWRSESDLKPESPSLATARSSPGAASSGSSHCDLGLMEAALSQAGSEPRLFFCRMIYFLLFF